MSTVPGVSGEPRGLGWCWQGGPQGHATALVVLRRASEAQQPVCHHVEVTLRPKVSGTRAEAL